MKQTKTKLSSGLHALLWKEGRWYVAKCVEIEVASQGKTKKAALTNLAEALALYFEDEPRSHIPTLDDIELRSIRPSYA